MLILFKYSKIQLIFQIEFVGIMILCGYIENTMMTLHSELVGR